MLKTPKLEFWNSSSTSPVTCVHHHTNKYRQGSGVAKVLDVGRPGRLCNFHGGGDGGRQSEPTNFERPIRAHELLPLAVAVAMGGANPSPRTLVGQSELTNFSGDRSDSSYLSQMGGPTHSWRNTPPEIDYLPVKGPDFEHLTRSKGRRSTYDLTTIACFRLHIIAAFLM